MRAGSPIFSYQNYMTLYTKLSDALQRESTFPCPRMRHKKRGTLHSVPLFLRLGPCNRAGHLKISRPRQYLPSWDGPFLLPSYPPVPAAYPLPQTAASEAALPLKAFPPEVPVLRSGDDSPPHSATPGTCGQTRTKVFGGWRGYGGEIGRAHV